jgi:multidrug efflux pump subunit AcrA (membrane-fusion protein)
MNLKQFIQSLNTAKVVGGIAMLALIVVLVQQVVAAPQVQGGGSTLEASGIIQAEDVAIASEFGGLITEIPVAEAEGVAKGDVLVQLDTALLDAKIEAANALVAMAEAGLAQAKAGARPGERAFAEAQLAQVEAYQTAAARAVADTQA